VVVLSEFSNLGFFLRHTARILSVSQYLCRMVLVVDILTEYCYLAVVYGRCHSSAVHNKRSQPDL
jgi:hypothetical protein